MRSFDEGDLSLLKMIEDNSGRPKALGRRKWRAQLDVMLLRSMMASLYRGPAIVRRPSVAGSCRDWLSFFVSGGDPHDLDGGEIASEGRFWACKPGGQASAIWPEERQRSITH